MRLIINLSLILVFVFSLSNTANATVYFYWDAEDHPCDGSELPNPPIWTQDVAKRGHVVCEPSPVGSRHIEFTTVNNQTNHYTEIHNTQGLPVNVSLGRTYYLAYYFNFTRINGLDIWHETNQSGDKGLEITGNGIRWEIGRGQWDSFSNNQDHRYSVWMGNPTYHLNRSLEVDDTYVLNQNGYSASNPIQLEYETWHSAVMAIKMASDNTGSITIYINGTKILEYNDIITTANGTPTITDIKLGGTIAQPAYDAPSHRRKFDALMLTDNWQDIIDKGYLLQLAIPNPPFLY